MKQPLMLKVSALAVCGALVAVLASACDLQYTCDTVEPGGAGAGYPTETIGAGDYLRDGEEDEAEEREDVDSDSLALMAGCSPAKTCTDMFVECQAIGGKCVTGYPGCDKYGKTSCGRCLEACNDDKPYPPECRCRSCGFQ